tara:strand:- start:6449 stop:7294 length:846 start_codon:yes stop_codon:yes gene_type:complete
MNFNKNKKLSYKFDVNYKKSNNKIKIKSLIFHKKKTLGRSKGKIVMRYKGGGHSKNYKLLNINNKFFDDIAIVRSIEYDPNRTTKIALIQYLNGYFSYISASKGLKINNYIYFYKEKNYGFLSFNYIIPNFSGDILLKLNDVPKGVPIYNIESIPNTGSIYAKSAGSKSYIIKKNLKHALICLPSKKERLFSLDCNCTLGTSSNIYHKYHKKYKAGTNRLLNRRPHVRGVAKNPVDHPHGGGEGKTSGGRPSVTPWGKITKGVPTSKTKKKLIKFIKKKIK